MAIKIILFPPGGSGHFLAKFLDTDETKLKLPMFRQDSIQVANPRQVFLNLLNQTQEQVLSKLDVVVATATNIEIILSHQTEMLELFADHLPNAWIRKIYPVTNMFGLIKNNIFKKRETEYVSYQYVDDFNILVDYAFLNINEQYQQYTSDTARNHIIDFGLLYNIEYLTNLFIEANHASPSNIKLNFAKEYISKQYPIINDTDSKDFNNIINHVNPTDYFDVAVCLYIYEKNHNTIDRNRNWSINNIPNTIDQALVFLSNNSKNYSIF